MTLFLKIILTSFLFSSTVFADATMSDQIMVDKKLLSVGEVILVHLKVGIVEASGNSLSFNTVGGSSEGSFGSVLDFGNGHYQTQFTATRAGTPIKIQAILNGKVVVESELISVTTGIVDIQKTHIDYGNNILKVGEIREVIISLNDHFGNPITKSPPVFVSIRFFGGTSRVDLSSSMIDLGNGVFVTSIKGLREGTAVTLLLSLGSLTHIFDSSQLTVVP